MNLVTLEESLLRDRGGELRDIEHLDGRWLTLRILLAHNLIGGFFVYLALWNEDSYRVVIAGGNGKVGNTLGTQLVPDGAQVTTLVELDLVGNNTGTVSLVESVLQVPARLILLHKSAHNLLLAACRHVLHRVPDLQVLDGISLLVLGWSLPGNDV